MRTIDDLPEDIQELARKAENLRRNNSRMMTRLEQVGVEFAVAYARIDHLIENLVLANVITDEQAVNINLDWEEHLNGQLMRAEAEVRKRLYEQQNRAKLLKPGKDF